MSTSFDDRPEFKRRTSTALGCGLLGALVAGMIAGDSGSFLAALAFMLSGVAGFVFPVRGGKLFSRPWGSPPRPVLAGNPLIPQRQQPVSWLCLCTTLAFAGCIGVNTLDVSPEAAQLDVLLGYVCAGVLWLLIMAQRTWLEVDVGSLRILRHRLLFGLRRSTVLSGSDIRFVACCRASSGAYDVFAFSHNREAFGLNGTYAGREDANFQAERLADQLMVPLLEGYSDSNYYQVLNLAKGHNDESMPYSRNWQPVETPAHVAAKRSELPPLP